MIDVYAVAAGPRRPPGVAGVEGSPVELLDHRALVVAVSRHAAAPPPTRAAALAHAAVCDELQALAEAVLPVRFGAVYADEPALRAALDERHADLAAGLDHVRGRVEVGVRVGWDPAGGDGDPAPSAPAPPATGAGGGGGPGRAYLLDRAAEERRRGARRERAERLAAAVHGAVAPLAADSRHRVLATGYWPPTASCSPRPTSSIGRAWTAWWSGPGRSWPSTPGWRCSAPGRGRPTTSRASTGRCPVADDRTLADRILSGPTPGDALGALGGEVRRLGRGLDRRVVADPENVERGLAQLVLTLVELLRQLMERQAVRRVEGGTLTDEEIERLGQTFLRLEQRMAELKETFGLDDDDLNLDLGPLGRLL